MHDTQRHLFSFTNITAQCTAYYHTSHDRKARTLISQSNCHLGNHIERKRRRIKVGKILSRRLRIWTREKTGTRIWVQTWKRSNKLDIKEATNSGHLINRSRVYGTFTGREGKLWDPKSLRRTVEVKMLSAKMTQMQSLLRNPEYHTATEHIDV